MTSETLPFLLSIVVAKHAWVADVLRRLEAMGNGIFAFQVQSIA